MKFKKIILVLLSTLVFSGCATNEWENVQVTEVAQVEGVEAITPTPTPKPNAISIVMVGDILLHTPVEAAALQDDGTYSFTSIFAQMKEQIEAADLAIVNQEVIIGGEELGISGYPAFNAPFAIGDALVESGFDVVCQGTNHALDKGRKGILNCMDFWQEHYLNIAVLGIHDSKEDQDEIYVY